MTESEVGSTRSYGNGAPEDAVKVTRSIMILKPPQLDMKDSPPASPAGSTTPSSTPPVSPFAGKLVIHITVCIYCDVVYEVCANCLAKSGERWYFGDSADRILQL